MPKPEVVVNTSQLRNAYKAHRNIYQTNENNASCQLLLFYAVEAGLKSKYLEEKRHQNTSDFKKEFGQNRKYGHEHNISRWVDELKIAAHMVRFSDNPSDPIENAHEKLRYGSSLANPTGREHIAYLRSILKYLSNNL